MNINVGQIRQIKRIKVIGGLSIERFEGVQVRIGSSSDVFGNELVHTVTGFSERYGTYEITFDAPIEGSYVGFVKKDHVQICKIEIYQ